MAKFITGSELEKVIYDIIWEAGQSLLIVSPYIKLDDYFKKLFDKHMNNPKIQILIVFGKNKGAVNKSLSENDIDYFKKFLNISIIYVPNLHAKFYSNESKSVITSINLYDYSFKNNVEFGVYSEINLLSQFTTTTDQEALKMSMLIAENNEVVFIKRPVYEKKMLSALLGKNYVKSDILHDSTEQFYNNGSALNKKNKAMKKLNDFPTELEIGSSQNIRPTRDEFEKNEKGFCIRTGKEIPFNPKQPFSEQAFKSWSQYSNPDYPEKFCHKTGQLSGGKTSMRDPILK